MLNRRTFLKAGASLPVGLRHAFAQTSEQPLRAHASARGVLYGAAASWPALRDNAEYAAHFAEECGILVPENALKMGPVHPEPDRYNFEAGDFMADFCQKHNMRMRGHTLVWHSQGWPWLTTTVTKENARQHLEDHIRTVAGRYRGRMHSWDVVNEVIQVQDGREDGLRNTPLLEMLGPEYIEIAFRVAHEADPSALLAYNDFGLDYDTPEQEQKRKAALGLLRRLKDRNVPITAFGTQAHLNWERRENIKAETQRNFLAEVAALGLQIYVTELDVTDRGLPDDIEERDKGVAEVYESYLSAVLDVPAVSAVLTWGLTDNYTWLAGRGRRPNGVTARVMPLDREYKRKPAWYAMARAFDNRKQS
jgi:endo-1,4-beta-xylanase